MTKKDYQAIAAALWRTRPEPAASNDPDRRAIEAMLGSWYGIVDAIATTMERDNSRFNRELFKEACETGRCRGMRQVA